MLHPGNVVLTGLAFREKASLLVPDGRRRLSCCFPGGGISNLVIAVAPEYKLDSICTYLNNNTGILHERIIAVVVEPMIRLRMREWPSSCTGFP